MWWYRLIPLSVALIAGCQSSPSGLLKEATGVASQTLCSKAFVSGLSPADVYREHVRGLPGMRWVTWALRYDVDAQAQEVHARIAGGFESHSVFRAGRGCTLVFAGRPLPTALAAMPHAQPLLPAIAGAEPVTPVETALQRAIDAAFAEPNAGPRRRTKAVVVVKDDRVIGERYAPGYGVDTPLLSHSVAKSVVNAMIGILARQGRLHVFNPAPVPPWAGTGDPRARITIDNLLRMNAGFDFDEGVFPSPAAHAWFADPDTARFAHTQPLASPVGKTWAYSSLSYAILSRIIGDAVGGGPQGVHDFAQQQLFDPLGMTSVTLEFDAAGTMMGAQSMFATARDWARLGLLYLHDGELAGMRILPQGWVAYSTRPTGANGYGAGFWLNTTSARLPRWGGSWGLPHTPTDAFMMRGYLGQYVVIVPAARLVVARFGIAQGLDADRDGVGRVVRDVIAATSPGR
jgi:CubicO group peptidase (beta-lactamase class C family)